MGTHSLRISCSFLILIAAFCTNAQKDDATPPPFPHISDLKKSLYQTEVTVTDVNQEVTAVATEYHYYANDSMYRGRLDVVLPQTTKSIVYFNLGGDRSQILEMGDMNTSLCKAWDIDESEFDYEPIFEGWLSKSSHLVIGPSAPLWFAQQYKDKIKPLGVNHVRNIPCNVYSLHIEDDKDNVTYFYYFAVDQWTTPYKMEGAMKVPIRIESRGMSGEKHVDYNTDFSYFKPSISDWTVFQPPIGIGCMLKEELQTKIPDFPDSFTFTLELIDLLKGTKDIDYRRVWYDADTMMARMDTFQTTQYTSELHDFNTGVTYSIASDQTCVIKPISDWFFEASGNWRIGRFKEPKELFGLEGDFYYMGRRYVRGIYADAYESVQTTGVVIEKLSLERFVITIFYSQDSYEIAVDGNTETKVPIFIQVTGWDKKLNLVLKKQYNIFAFNNQIIPAMYDSFNLKSCFPSKNDKSHFVLMMNSDQDISGELEYQDPVTIATLRNEIVAVTRVSPMRVPSLIADYATKSVYVQGLLLDRPPVLKQFTMEYQGGITIHDNYFTTAPATVDTREKCAYACVDMDEFICKGFYMCKNSCYLKSHDILEKVNQTEKIHNLDEDCETWLRSVSDSNNKEPYLSDAMQLLEKAVLNGSFVFNVQFQEDVTIQFSMKEILFGDGPLTGDNDQKPYTQVLKYVKLKRDDDTTQVMQYIDSIMDCYKACKTEGVMTYGECSSFSYCPDSPEKDCRLSTKLITSRANNVADTEDDKNCFVYSMKYMDFFDAYPGTVSLVGGDLVYEKIFAVEECAKKCRQEKSITCRGFEYCPSVRTCVIHSKHILDFPDHYTTDKKSTCKHYAAKFSADYYDMGSFILDDNNGDERKDLSLEECSRICSEELKDNCKSFNYCPPPYPDEGNSGSSCTLSFKNLKEGTTTTKGKCRHYAKKEIVADWGKIIPRPLASVGYTKKGFAGLVIGLLAFGVLVGAIAFTVYSYLKSRSSGEGMSVRFVKSDI